VLRLPDRDVTGGEQREAFVVPTDMRFFGVNTRQGNSLDGIQFVVRRDLTERAQAVENRAIDATFSNSEHINLGEFKQLCKTLGHELTAEDAE